jgi:rhodanese-related sulfurtransferase
MKATMTLRWKTFGFALMILVGALLAIMPSRLVGASLETRLAEYAAALPAQGFTLTAKTLAEWLGASKPVAMVDVRERWEYDEFHVEGAGHVPLRSLVSPEGIKALPNDRPIVVIGRADSVPGEAVTVLRLAGKDAYALDGGLAAWWREVLTPASIDPSVPIADRPTVAARRAAWRVKFIGSGAGLAAAPASGAPTTPAPPPPGAPKTPVPRGKGC